jgi:hypothetical protein
MSIKKVRGVLHVNAWVINAKHAHMSMKKAMPVACARVKDRISKS